MLQESEFYCPECDDGLDTPTNRREFLRTAGGAAALGAMSGGLVQALEVDPSTTRAKSNPAEEMIREFYLSLKDDQKKQLIYPWDHGARGRLSRLTTPNSALFGKRIGQSYTKPQQEQVKKILRAILADDEAFTRISRNGSWDGSRTFEGCGAVLFGDPKDKEKFAWVFTGHHLTVRCDGNSVPGAAFGGPIYYGHSAQGTSARNVWFYQTKRVQSVYDALDEKQKKKALATKKGVDRERSLQPNNPALGIQIKELSADQKKLVEDVMKDLLSPFRKEDGEEVIQLIKANGGMEKIHLAFYGKGDGLVPRWDYWRLEGPGFIWNYRVLPHVHCYVNIATRLKESKKG